MNYKKHFRYLLTDFRGELSFLVSILCRYLSILFSGIVTKIIFCLKGVIHGKNNLFIGLPRVKRLPSTIIIIGNDCEFFSNTFSNQIGINRPCMMSTQSDGAIIEIGDKCGFSGTVIGAFQYIKIGDNVRCGANTLITDSDWHIDDKRSGGSKKVEINNNVWIGEGVKILKGVVIGENSVIGAGSVVVNNIPPNVVAAGNPCRVIRSLLNC